MPWEMRCAAMYCHGKPAACRGHYMATPRQATKKSNTCAWMAMAFVLEHDVLLYVYFEVIRDLEII